MLSIIVHHIAINLAVKNLLAVHDIKSNTRKPSSPAAQVCENHEILGTATSHPKLVCELVQCSSKANAKSIMYQTLLFPHGLSV
jgi:hypothetical protein